LNDGEWKSIWASLKSFQDKLIEAAEARLTLSHEWYATKRLSLRREYPTVWTVLPDFVREEQQVSSVCNRIVSQAQGTTRLYVEGAFARAFEEAERLRLEEQRCHPCDQDIVSSLDAFNSPVVQDVWKKAAARRRDDPDGAITTARTLLETICKNILTERGIRYHERDDLPKLYSSVAKTLTLAPTEAANDDMRQVCQGCVSVVQGVGAFRNRAYHAALAVNLAGSLAAFLIEAHGATPSRQAGG
jgi:hypothetical protein